MNVAPISFTTAAIDKNSRVARTVRQANANSYCVGLSAATSLARRQQRQLGCDVVRVGGLVYSVPKRAEHLAALRYLFIMGAICRSDESPQRIQTML